MVGIIGIVTASVAAARLIAKFPARTLLCTRSHVGHGTCAYRLIAEPDATGFPRRTPSLVHFSMHRWSIDVVKVFRPFTVGVWAAIVAITILIGTLKVLLTAQLRRGT